MTGNGNPVLAGQQRPQCRDKSAGANGAYILFGALVALVCLPHRTLDVGGLMGIGRHVERCDRATELIL